MRARGGQRLIEAALGGCDVRYGGRLQNFRLHPKRLRLVPHFAGALDRLDGLLNGVARLPEAPRGCEGLGPERQAVRDVVLVAGRSQRRKPFLHLRHPGVGRATLDHGPAQHHEGPRAELRDALLGREREDTLGVRLGVRDISADVAQLGPIPLGVSHARRVADARRQGEGVVTQRARSVEIAADERAERADAAHADAGVVTTIDQRLFPILVEAVQA